MMMKDVPVHDGDKISWVTSEKRGWIDASDLARPMCGRIYDDACDVGFKVRSPRTGAVKLFVLVRTFDDGEDVTAWHFVAADDPDLVIDVAND